MLIKLLFFGVISIFGFWFQFCKKANPDIINNIHPKEILNYIQNNFENARIAVVSDVSVNRRNDSGMYNNEMFIKDYLTDDSMLDFAAILIDSLGAYIYVFNNYEDSLTFNPVKVDYNVAIYTDGIGIQLLKAEDNKGNVISGSQYFLIHKFESSIAKVFWKKDNYFVEYLSD